MYKRQEVDEAHAKRGTRFSRQLVKSSDYEDHIDRRPLRSEAALLLWQEIIPFAVIAQAIGDYLEKNLTSVRHKQDATIITTLRPVLLVQHYDRGIFALLRYTPALPYGDHNGMELLQYMAVTITSLI